MELLRKLKAGRARIAKNENKPLYMVALNAELVEMATNKPTTKEELIALKNIGERKYEASGRYFIAIILEHLQGRK